VVAEQDHGSHSYARRSTVSLYVQVVATGWKVVRHTDKERKKERKHTDDKTDKKAPQSLGHSLHPSQQSGEAVSDIEWSEQ
jgi:hypothetical protein